MIYYQSIFMKKFKIEIFIDNSNGEREFLDCIVNKTLLE